MRVDDLARQAMTAIDLGDPAEARRLLHLALEEAPGRPDLLHALGRVELLLGEPASARARVREALDRLMDSHLPEADLLRVSFVLTLATVAQELDEPAEAISAFQRVQVLDPGNPEACSGLAFLYLSLGELDRGLAELDRFGTLGADPEARDAHRATADALRVWLADPTRDPRRFLEAHQGIYARFFDHHARAMEKKGWLAERALSRRGPDGGLVPHVPDGARPYAAHRIDLVDPATGQGGRIGDQPMVSALAGFEALARAPVLLPWSTPMPFDVRVSTICPWNDLPIQVALVAGDPHARVDPVVGAWYAAGFEGAFGSGGRGFFHQISEPESRRRGALAWNVDLGRAGVAAIDDLVARLVALHATVPLRALVIGRGFLPA